MAHDPLHLSRRERQIMEAIYTRGEASANDVLAAITHPPSRTAVRTLLRILEHKKHLVHRKVGKEYFYKPIRPRAVAGKSVLKKVLATFFGGSIERAVAAHLSDPKTQLSPEELARLQQLIDQARDQGEST